MQGWWIWSRPWGYNGYGSHLVVDSGTLRLYKRVFPHCGSSFISRIKIIFSRNCLLNTTTNCFQIFIFFSFAQIRFWDLEKHLFGVLNVQIQLRARGAADNKWRGCPGGEQIDNVAQLLVFLLRATPTWTWRSKERINNMHLMHEQRAPIDQEILSESLWINQEIVSKASERITLRLWY